MKTQDNQKDNTYIKNHTFDEIKIGDKAHLTRVLTWKDIELFAIMSGDVNPAHVDKNFAKSDVFRKVIAHGMWGGSLISTVLGTELPGPGTIYLEQSLKFLHPVGVGDTITVMVEVTKKDIKNHHVILQCQAVNQDDKVVIDGTARVIAPVKKIRRRRVKLPTVELVDSGRYLHAYIAQAQRCSPLKVAVVHPVDPLSLQGAIQAAEAGLIIPALVGPEHKIVAAAEKSGIDLSPYEVITTQHSHEAAQQAVELARQGQVDALMKGSLHTEEFMLAILDRNKGLRTERRMSHVFVVDLPAYEKPIFITDAAINVAPTIEEKRDIIQNAIDLVISLGIKKPRVAILSAVESVTARIPSTIEAAALCKMADRGQISGGTLDGPLGYDNAVSQEAAQIKGIQSHVAGQADILVVPDLESGNMLAKQLEYLAKAEVAGIVLGAKVPIILTSRADKPLFRLASSALAVIYAMKKGQLTI
jgi:phosphotransacetylase/acyl dehydratase